MTRIDPPLPLETPKGKGLAYFVIDYGIDHDLLWVVFLNQSRECWTFKNSQIKIVENFSIGRI